ncbi:hypothetical protein EV426DRAFT_540551 [Tirmania nivea]|nr:hypothetical protein EV426DRAFT_540551 [Tirmania nivea]
MARRTPGNNPYGQDDEEEDYVPKSGRSHERYALARPDPRGTMQSRSNSNTSTHSTGNNNPTGSARRRIPVACGRCRQRKIRCSGDTDGLGCTNCRGASILPAFCTFLRVQFHHEILGDNVQVLMQNALIQAGSNAMELHPYAAATASASAPSLTMSPYDSVPAHSHTQSIRPSHSTTSLNPSFHNGINDMTPLKPIYHVEASHHNNGQESRSGALGSDSDSTSNVYDGNIPQFMLPEIANGGMQQDHLRQWTPLSTANHRSSLFLDPDTVNSQSFLPNSRMSPGTLDVYSAQANVFPALANLSDNLPAGTGSAPVQTYIRGDSSYVKQPEKITLPTIQGYSRSQALDLNSMATRTTGSTTLNEASLTYTPSQYKSYSWAAEPSLSAPMAPVYTFSAPLKSRQLTVGGSHYPRESVSRSSPPVLLPASTLKSTSPNARIGSNYPTGYSSSTYSGQTHLPFSLSSANTSLLPTHSSTVLNSPTIAMSAPSLEGDKRGNGEVSKGPSSDSTGSSVPASPYSSSPTSTSTLYETTRSQPPTPVPTRSASDKGLHTYSSTRRHVNRIY